MLSPTNSTIELASLLKVKVLQGSEDSSAPIDKLGFAVKLTGFDSKSISLAIEFDSPLSISVGHVPDFVLLVFTEPGLFVSKRTGLPLAQGANVAKKIPKQFPS